MVKIAVVFPKSNPFVKDYPKPVVIASFAYIKYSRLLSDMVIVSPFADNINDDYNVYIVAKEKCSRRAYKKEVLKYLEKQKPKLIEVHQDIKLAGFLAKKLPEIKVIAIKHGDGFFHLSKERYAIFRKFYYKFYLKHIKHFLSISSYVKKNLQGLYPILQDNITVAYNSYGFLQKYLEKEQYIKKEKQIIFVGKPVSYKGFFEFIEALVIILNKYKDYKGMVVAAVFSDKTKYTKGLDDIMKVLEVDNLIKEKRLIIKKRLSNIESFQEMQKSSIAVMPTKSNEPFGLVAMEYHLARCSVISSGRGALKEISSSNALYLKEISSYGIANKIEEFILNKNLSEAMAKDGYDYVLEKFSPKKLCQQLDQKRENLINERS